LYYCMAIDFSIWGVLEYTVNIKQNLSDNLLFLF